MKSPLKHVVGGALLVAGTSIGAGMLALPVVTGLGGFIPAVVVYLLCWAIMTITGLLFLEICLRLPDGTNIISMTRHYLGKKGKIAAWILYLFLFYCLSIAYVSKGGSMVAFLFQGKISYFTSVVIFMLFFGLIVYFGTRTVDRINFLLMIGLFISYFVFIFFGFSYVQEENFAFIKFQESIWALPVVVISFGYQGIVPTLTTYLKRDAKRLRMAIFSGTTLTLIIYLIWEYFILGIIPVEGTHGLIEAKAKGFSAVEPLRHFLDSKVVYTIAEFFSFFAITTSFLGVSMALFDFFADGLKLPKKGKYKLLIALCTFLPTFLIASTHPGLFIIALEYAGGIGGILLLILLPAVLVYVARYKKKDRLVKRQVFGGKGLLWFLFFFCLVEIFLDFVIK